MHNYNSEAKERHRSFFVESLNKKNDGGKFVYTESPDAIFTRQLLDNGIDSDRLHPVNHCEHACAQITENTGVSCMHAKMENAVGSMNGKSMNGNCVSCVWFDLESQDIDQQHVDQAADALVPNGILALTLSSSHVKGGCDTQMKLVKERLAGAKLSISEVSQYKGAGGVMNMVIGFATKHENATMHEERDLIGCMIKVFSRTPTTLESVDGTVVFVERRADFFSSRPAEIRYVLRKSDGRHLNEQELHPKGTPGMGYEYVLASIDEEEEYQRDEQTRKLARTWHDSNTVRTYATTPPDTERVAKKRTNTPRKRMHPIFFCTAGIVVPQEVSKFNSTDMWVATETYRGTAYVVYPLQMDAKGSVTIGKKPSKWVPFCKLVEGCAVASMQMIHHDPAQTVRKFIKEHQKVIREVITDAVYSRVLNTAPTV